VASERLPRGTLAPILAGMKALPAASFSLLLLMIGCRGGNEAAERAIAALVPGDAVVFVRLLSIDDLVDTARTSATPFGVPTELIGAEPMLARLGPMGGDTTYVDKKRPIAFALVAPRAVQPTPLVFVPVTDAAKYVASLQGSGMQTFTDGGYVVLPLAGKYEKPAQPSALAANLPAELVVARVDVAKAAQNLGTVIGAGLTAFKAMLSQVDQGNAGVDGAAVADLYIEAAKALLASGQSLELAADAPHGKLAVSARMQMKSGSDLDGWGSAPVDLASFAGKLSPRSAANVVMVADWKALWPRFESMLDAIYDLYPPQGRAAMREMMHGYRELYEAMGPVLVADVDIDGKGLGMTVHMTPAAAESMFSLFATMARSPQLATFGAEFVPGESGEVDGARFQDHRLRLDFVKFASAISAVPVPDSERGEAQAAIERVLGMDGLLMRLAAKGGSAAIGVGHRAADTVAALGKSGGSWPASMRAAMAAVGDCNPMVVECIDFMALFRGMQEWLPGIVPPGLPQFPAGTSADFVIAAGIRGAEWRAHFAMDLVGFGKAMQAASGR